jgi:ABC-type Fe3+-hydroxamate transport system substrate-binding protein
MKEMRKILPFLLILCLLLAACANTGNSADKKSNETNDEEARFDVDSNATADAKGTPSKKTEAFALYPAFLRLPLSQHVTPDTVYAPAGKTLVWASSDASVATVDDSGRITPLTEGETIVTATASDDASIMAACGVLVVADGNIFLWER